MPYSTESTKDDVVVWVRSKLLRIAQLCLSEVHLEEAIMSMIDILLLYSHFLN